MSTELPTLLVLASTFPRWKNDTEPRFVYDLCLRLKKDYNVIVLAPHCINAKQYELLEGIHVYRYRYAFNNLENLAYEGGITARLKQSKINYLVLPFFFIGQWWGIQRLLRQFPIKAIHAHWLIPQGLVALLARPFSRNRPAILCTSHGGDLYSLKDPVSMFLKRWVIRNVDALSVVSSSMKQEVFTLVPKVKDVTVASMGTDLNSLFIPDLSVKRQSFRLLFVGRLVEKKGLKYLIKALPMVIEEYPKVVLDIVGSGPERASLIEQVGRLGIDSHVKFLGRQSHQELVGLYQTATLAVFPFVKAKNGDIEGLGLVSIEAQGCETPIIASDIPAVHDIVENDVSGILVSSADSDALARKIKELLSSPEKAKKIGRQGRKSALSKFSWEVSARRYSILIKKIIS